MSKKVVLISGANRGMGKAIAEKLYSEGYYLSLGARDVQKLQEVTKDWDQDRVLTVPYEATDKQSPYDWVNATVKKWERIDGVVNNAGVLACNHFEDLDEAIVDQMWEVNTKGPMRLSHAAFKHLKQVGNGRVVNIISMSGKRVGDDNYFAYSMSKFGAMALTRAIQAAGKDYGIRASSICPSYTNTDMIDGIINMPKGQMTQPEDIAEMVSLLLRMPNQAYIDEIDVTCKP
jgi:NAD(P)-dependent dehydrogenase (short-subunit alcohol dehydrogenase family)